MKETAIESLLLLTCCDSRIGLRHRTFEPLTGSRLTSAGLASPTTASLHS